MFTNISWGSYFIAISALLLLWYLFLVIPFYYPDLKQIFNVGKFRKAFCLMDSYRTQFSHRLPNDSNPKSNNVLPGTESPDTLEEIEELSARIITAINESAQKKLSQEQLQNYLKLVLSEYPFVRISSLRYRITLLMVDQCAKHPQFFLTPIQAEELWEEAI